RLMLAPAWGPRGPMPVLRSRGPRLHCLPGARRPAECRGPSRRLCPQCKRRHPRDRSAVTTRLCSCARGRPASPPAWPLRGGPYSPLRSPGDRMKGTSHSRRDILRTAARLFQERGYDATSMQDIASALNFSKAALYHHFESKEEILQQIMGYGMDIFEERVVEAVKAIPDPEQRLRACIALHIGLVLSGHDREITV